MRRSLLFLPGNTPNMLINGGTLRADAVILDLEDSVAPTEKDAARLLVRNALQTLDFGCETVVRINFPESEFGEKDLGLAVVNNCVGVAQWLVEQGLDVNSPEVQGMVSAESSKEKGFSKGAEALRYLIGEGFKPGVSETNAAPVQNPQKVTK